jgi:hypothetical protein
MKITEIPSPPPADLATEAVRLGRELERMANAVGLNGGSRDAAPVSAMLRRLAARAAFDPLDGAALEALGSFLEAELAMEIVGSRREFLPTYRDEHFEDGEVLECRVYSPRGQELLRLQSIVTAFVEAREAVLDRAAAERALRDLLAPWAPTL